MPWCCARLALPERTPGGADQVAQLLVLGRVLRTAGTLAAEPAHSRSRRHGSQPILSLSRQVHRLTVCCFPPALFAFCLLSCVLRAFRLLSCLALLPPLEVRHRSRPLLHQGCSMLRSEERRTEEDE